MSNLKRAHSLHSRITRGLPHLKFALSALVSSLVLMTFSTATVAAEKGVMLGGYDPVSYFSTTGPQLGNASIAIKHRGAKYVFRSIKNAQQFQAEPERFLPQFGGNCAYGMAFGAKSSVNPKVWRVIDGKLYLLINRGTLRAWDNKPNFFINRAKKAWNIVRKD